MRYQVDADHYLWSAFAQLLLTSSLLAGCAGMLVAKERPDRPNFVFFLVDDLGWADVGCFGSTFYETPHIDRLAGLGMRFTQSYAACPVCSPTRASILTGRHPVRVNITDWIPGMRAERHPNPRFLNFTDRDNLALDEVTIAEVLKEYGYQTFFAGKWHLGERGHWPTDQGFDVNVGGNSKGSPPGGYYAPWTNPTLEANRSGEYLTERLTDESVAFLRSRQTDAPFLLYLSYYNVHTPITAYAKRVAHFEAKAGLFTDSTPWQKERNAQSRLRQDNPSYASMIAAVDDSVGRILDQLRDLGVHDNTIVFFFSDNGGLCTNTRIGPTSNLPLRSGKGWLYEGGIREPTIVYAPGVTTAGSTSDAPIVSMDFFPTILDLANIPLRPNLHVDGTSMLPLLTGLASTATRALFWHYPHYHGSTWTPGAAVRNGNWKLIELYHWQQVELFNLKDDPGELNDLSLRQPEKTRQLLDQLHAWQQQIGARLPERNPNWRESE